ncbi:putative metal cation transporting P-type ATPase CtpH [Mycobacterium tuberculosis H37Rv] [Mycobacterium shimoidei]|uniref:Putative metal cation transporting P-type ATPase CtpH [Mycobacterium tuberculosis H37Rv] n=1 Tax=Mycobacterium shimoidei TaxID=29313 RepID=A0A375YU35_MYCSH|nr:putative metal cation transporting P-type ATPase CtpH [Mycobacterium tuberculosis H37Rv] [Mycobacterium shimoidei]
MRRSLPLRALTLGIQATAALAGATLQTATQTAGTLGSLASTGLSMAAIPVREGVRAVAGELPGTPALNRHCWRDERRAWIEVRGLDRPGGDELGRVVVDAVAACPGVTSATLNRPWSRLVVGLDDEAVSLRELCRVVDDAEKSCQAGRLSPRAQPLPGDSGPMANKAVAVGATAAGMAAATVGRMLRWPGLPDSVEAAVVAVDYQPRLRQLLENRIGHSATDTALTIAMTAAHVVSLSPASLAIDLMMEVLKAAESRSAARVWRQHEPRLAAHAAQAQIHAPWRPVPPPTDPAERYARLAARVQAVGAGLVGAGTRSVGMAATAALVAAPKALRTTRESFAATLGQGLADQHGILPLRPDSLRRLDQIDALLVDPRVLCTEKLRIGRVRGARDDELAAVWNRAQALLAAPDVRVGWHSVPGARGGKVEALVCPTHDPLAAAVLAEAHHSGVDLISIDIEALGDLRPAFDEIRPLEVGSVDHALTDALARLQRDGHVVAVLSAAAGQALASADVALGVMPRNGTDPPPWYADLVLPDLAAVWRVLHALPAAKTATRRGIEISTGASALGALLMLPGVRGRGPGPVTTGAGAGLLSGCWAARQILLAPTPRAAPMHEWHAMSVDQVRQELPPPGSPESAQPGRAAAAARRGADLTGRPRRAMWQFVRAVRAELSDPLTPVLALGSAASAVLGSPVDALLVGSVLTGNAMLAASQRLRAEGRLNQLLAQQIPPARKVTFGADGTPVYTDVIAAQLRPGDVIEVRTHEVVPADARLIEEDDLEVDESTLTGESLPVEKQVEPTPGVELAERRCMLFAGTTVVAGTAVALVTAVGADTQARRAADLVSGQLAPVGLQHQLSQLTNRAFPISMGGGALVSGLGLLRSKGLRQAVASGIAVTVAAVPEGMPLVATLAQAASARRLTNFGALVRVPRSVEALGRVDVVCFDKTGTLSENRLRVTQVHPVAGNSREEVLRCAAHAAPTANGNPQVHATDRAIIDAAVNGSTPAEAPFEPDAHLPFRSGRSFSASVSGDELTVKGAPEVVLRVCQDGGTSMDRAVRELAGQGLRVIAVARRQLTPQQADAVRDDEDAIAEMCEDGLSLVGFLGISDTPRAEAPGLLAALAERDTAIRLITGDHPITATAIARELGLPVTPDQVISGAEWDELSRKDQERAVAERVIFARMSPENKVQIVQTLERTGKVCAMVGDGSNDAAAIRAATVGIAVVASSSDPARTAADVVLVDGRIEALLHAIEEGRELWRRVQAAVSVLLGGNAGEVGFAILGSALTGRSPLNTRQLLLVNMLTDALPAAALAVSPTTGPAARGGRGPDEQALWRAVAVRGTTTAAAATAAWAMAEVTGRPQRASTIALVALVSAQLGQTLLDSRAPLVVFTAFGSLCVMATLISIPVVSQLLGCTPLGPVGWAQGLGPAAVATGAQAVANRLMPGGRAALPEPDRRADEYDQPPQHRPATTRHTAESPDRSAGRPSLRLVDQPEHQSSSSHPRQ